MRTAGALSRLLAGVLPAALVVRLLDEWWSYLPGGAIEDLRRDLGVGYGRSGWLLTLMLAGGLLASPVASLADRGHRRALAMGGAVALSASLAAFAAGAPYWVLAVASVVAGGASDLVIRPLESSMAEVAGERLDRLLGGQHLLTWLGDLVAPALLAVGAATAIGWQGAFAITSGAYLLFAGYLALIPFPSPRPVTEGDDAPWWSAMGSLMRHRQVLAIAAAELITGPLDEPLLGFAVARAAARGRGAMAQAIAIGVVVGGIAGTIVVRHLGLTSAMRRAGAPIVVAGVVASIPSTGVAVQAAAFGLVGFGTAIVWVALHHRMLTVIPQRSSMVPTVVGVLSAPGVFLPAAIGWIAERTSLTAGLAAYAAVSLPLLVIMPWIGDGSASATEVTPAS